MREGKGVVRQRQQQRRGLAGGSCDRSVAYLSSSRLGIPLAHEQQPLLHGSQQRCAVENEAPNH